jgi:HK97 family phage portal protein
MGLLTQATKQIFTQQKAPNYTTNMPSFSIRNKEGGNSLLNQLSAMPSSSWLFAVVDRISSAVAANEWSLFQTRTNTIQDEITNHPLLSLWHSVNPFYTMEEFLECTTQHFELCGEMWWLLIRGENGLGPPTEIWPIRPDRMRPIPHATEFIVGYEYQPAGRQDPIPLRIEDVLFIRRPSPVDMYRGIGVIQSLMTDLGAEQAAAQWTANFFSNSAMPGGIIEYEEGLDDDDFERAVERWRVQHQGVGNAHRVAILERGKWVDRKYTQRDMEFAELRKLNRDQIIGAFGVPLPILGITESVNRANAEAAEVLFSRWVIKPRLRRLRAKLNEKLAPEFGEGLKFEFIDPTPEDRQLNLQEAVSGYTNGLLTLNESRMRLGESNTKEGGDEFKPSSSPLALASISKAVSHMKAISDEEATINRNWRKRLAAEVDGLVDYLTQFFVTPALQQIISDTAWKDIPLRQKIELEDLELPWGYNWDWWVKYGDAVVGELAGAFEVAIVADFPEFIPVQAQRLAAEYAANRGEALLRLDGDINLQGLTRRKVNQLVSRAIDEGQSIGTITKELKEDYAFSPERAETIARTETATAQGQGTRSAALEQGRNEKRWITAGDDVVESDCIANQGAGWIKIAATFPTGKDTIPQHPRCRCVVRYRTVDKPTVLAINNNHKARCVKGHYLGENLTGSVFCSKCKKLINTSE